MRRKGWPISSPARAATERLKAALAKLGDARTSPRATGGAWLLARILVPINYTREPRFRHDPAYTVPPLPTLAVAADGGDGERPSAALAQVELMRGQNRYVAAIDEARRIVSRVG